MSQKQEITDASIKDKIKIFITEKFLLGDKFKTPNEDQSFLEKGIIDSTGILELVSFIEETFGVKLEDEELIPDNLDSLNNLSEFIKQKAKST